MASAAVAPAPAATAPSTTPAPTATAPAAAAGTTPPARASATGPVQLTAVQPTWVKISERDGATLFMGVLDKGKTYDVPTTATDPVIRTGKPEGLAVTVGGQPVAPLGRPAHTISNVSLKANALTHGGAAAPAAGTAPAGPSAGTTNSAAVPPAFRPDTPSTNP